MLFNSFHFLLFFPIVALFYFVIPHRYRYIWLLIASYYFYMSWNAKYALLIFTSTLITYLSGLMIDKANSIGDDPTRSQRLKKLFVALSFLINLAILVFFKYANFIVSNINTVLAMVGIESTFSKGFDVLLPVGISFYTFQALGYTMDVYRKTVPAEKNFFKYALFVSFFPQLVAGPIERTGNLLGQFSERHTFDFNRVKHGLLLMLWGLFQKMVIADRLALLVEQVYSNYSYYAGMQLAIATVLFALQIYMDFASYSTIAIGAAEVMGFRLMRNFNTPYFSQSVAEFWRRWHISLSSWFRDYLYFPLGGSRKGKFRKYINILIVFLVSGLWHGASWHFIIWGLLNGLFQVVEEVILPLQKKLSVRLHINRENFGSKMFRMLLTFILINITWVFFRAPNLSAAVSILSSIFTVYNPWVLLDGSLLLLGLSVQNLIVLVISILILIVVDIYQYRGGQISTRILAQGVGFQWLIFLGLLFGVIIFGIYGAAYNATNFIYFQF